MASKRGYITIAEIGTLVSALSTGVTDEQISEAEELIDSYIGYQDQFIEPGYYFRGQVSNASATTKIIDNTGGNQLFRINNFFIGCMFEVIGGTGIGQRGIIASSNQTEQSVTLAVALTTPLDLTSEWKIYQLGKFPRREDVIVRRDSSVYYKSIPEAIKRATAYQVEFMLTQGANYFNTDQTDMTSERIGNYEYVKGARTAGAPSALVNMIAPKARGLLKGYKNSTGRISVGDLSGSQNQAFYP